MDSVPIPLQAFLATDYPSDEEVLDRLATATGNEPSRFTSPAAPP